MTKLLHLSIVVTVLSAFLCAQQTNSTIIGLPAHGIFSGNAFDSIQLNNGNLHIEIPLWSDKGRGLDSSYSLVYDNKGWTVNQSCNTFYCDAFIDPSGNMQWNLAVPSYNLE